MSAKYGKLLKVVGANTHKLHVYNNREWEEYVAVVFYIDGSKYGIPVGTHHDTDKEDVIRTGEAMLNQCVINNITTRVGE